MMKHSILSIAAGVSATLLLTQCGKFPSIYDPIEPPPWKKADPDSFDDPSEADQVEAGTERAILEIPEENNGSEPDLIAIDGSSGLQPDQEDRSDWSRVNLTNFKFLSDPANKLPGATTSIELNVEDISKDAKSIVYTTFSASAYAGKKVRLSGEVSGLEVRPGSVCEVMLRSWSGARSLAARTSESFATVRNASQAMKTVALSKSQDLLEYNSVDLELDVNAEAEWIGVIIRSDNGSIKARGLSIEANGVTATNTGGGSESLSEIVEPETPGTTETAELPYGLPTDEPGVVISPYVDKKARVGDLPRGQRVECPHTGKIFLVP